ncbi:MAG TPA: hypothetical protein VF043_16530 [Ktedonobacteraceae bacterium]
MTSIASSPLHIQACTQSVPVLPCWFGELTLIIHHMQRQGVLVAIEEQVHFARRRFGRYELIDFVAVLFGYAISGERTLDAFYERVQPWASTFMALFGREGLPSRSALSRFLAALDQTAVEALRTLFLTDLLARPLTKEEQAGGLFDRQGNQYLVFDVDGTREAARQRALPQTADRPPAQRRLRPLCAPGYTGRKRGEVVRSRTTVLQAHTHQWIATFGNSGNGEYRAELRRAVTAIQRYLQAHHHPAEHVLLRLDGQYGTGAILTDLAGLPFVMRGKTYHLLKRAEIQARLSLPADHHLTHTESGITRALYDFPAVPVGPEGIACRVVVATHPAGPKKSPVGVTRAGVVFELFLTGLPQQAFTAADVVELYLHRGAFETTLSDEDQEQDPDRWVNHAATGQEVWQLISQWVWNLRLELGHQLQPEPVRTTEFAPASPPRSASTAPYSGYAPPQVGSSWKAGRFWGPDFALQPDGTLRCPAEQTLIAQERRREADGSLRVVYAASIRSCRPCPLREYCQWNGSATAKPRQVSVLLHPLRVGPAPLLWRDWSRRQHRRACLQVRSQRIEVQLEPALPVRSDPSPPPLSRAKRAHARLTFPERLARNTRTPGACRVTITLFGIPERFATSLGLATA